MTNNSKADLLRQLGLNTAALQAYQQALLCCKQAPEQRFLQQQIDTLHTATA